MRKIFRLLIFVVISLAIFYITFGYVGSFLSSSFQTLLTNLFDLIPHVSQLHSLFVPLDILHSGLFPVITTLLGFLPQVIILFTALELLKFIPMFAKYQHLMLGFGCTTLAVSTICDKSCKTKRCREITLLTFIPCGAKMPIMMIIINGFFAVGFLVMYTFYVGAVLLGLVSYYIYKKFQERKNSHVILKEAKNPAKHEKKNFNYKNILFNTKDFLKRLGIPVITISLILYFLANYNFHLRHTTDITQTMLYNIATIFSPLFEPIGLGPPVIITALIFGLIGKEMMAVPLATLGMPIFTTAGALSFMAFAILYPVCVSAIIAIRNKTSTKFAVGLMAFNLIVAYMIAFLIFNLA